MNEKFPFANAELFLAGLDFQPLGANSPEAGDVVMFSDGSWVVVGTSSHVSYGPRDEMVSVARLYPHASAEIAAVTKEKDAADVGEHHEQVEERSDAGE